MWCVFRILTSQNFPVAGHASVGVWTASGKRHPWPSPAVHAGKIFSSMSKASASFKVQNMATLKSVPCFRNSSRKVLSKTLGETHCGRCQTLWFAAANERSCYCHHSRNKTGYDAGAADRSMQSFQRQTPRTVHPYCPRCTWS